MLPVVNPNLNLNDYSFNVVKVDISVRSMIFRIMWCTLCCPMPIAHTYILEAATVTPQLSKHCSCYCAFLLPFSPCHGLMATAIPSVDTMLSLLLSPGCKQAGRLGTSDVRRSQTAV